MSTYPDWRAGMKLTAARLTARQWNALIKAADQTAPSTAFVDDDTLLFPVAANASYLGIFLVAGYATFDGAGNPSSVNTEITVPASATGFKWCVGPFATATTGSTDRENTNLVTAVHGHGTDRRYGHEDGSTVSAFWKEYVTVITAGTAGNVQYRFARGNTDTNSTGIIGRSGVVWVRVA